MSVRMVMVAILNENLFTENRLGKQIYQITIAKSLKMGDTREAKKNQQTRRTLRISVQANHTMRKEVIFHFQRSILQAEELPSNQDKATTYFDITDLLQLK